MPHPQDHAERLIATLEIQSGQSLSPDQVAEIELWEKGRALAQVSAFPGYQIILEILQSQPTQAMADLMKIKPGDNDRILAAHAVAYAANEGYINSVNAINAAIEASKTTPDVVKDGFRKLKTATPAESM